MPDLMQRARVEGIDVELFNFSVYGSPAEQEEVVREIAQFLADGWAVVASGGGDQNAWIVFAQAQIVPDAGIEVSTPAGVWPFIRPPGTERAQRGHSERKKRDYHFQAGWYCGHKNRFRQASRSCICGV